MLDDVAPRDFERLNQDTAGLGSDVMHTHTDASKRILPILFLLAAVATNSPPAAAQGVERGDRERTTSRFAREPAGVKILDRTYNNTVAIFAVLTNCTEATITLDIELTNARASKKLPITVDAAGRARFEILRLRPIDPNRQITYQFRYQWKPGGRLVAKKNAPPFRHEAIYALPHDPSATFQVVQGRLGRLSHQLGSRDEEAIDWSMPIGTRVLAARGGKVVAVRQESNTHSDNGAQREGSNFIVIKHDDGTFAEYQHLRQYGAAVKLGQVVATGELIGYSGDTGFATMPHLHFAVYHNIDGERRVTYPLMFRLKSGEVVALQEGDWY